ncbi:MAG: hypothetical protein JEY94_05500 [Melioribacteraceae bacterium]|nr:hypothetical protein [Melioribacteraceae bacterium]
MTKAVRIFSIIFILAGFLAEDYLAQSDINIFGFYQAYARKVDGDFKVTGDVPYFHPQLGLITLEDQVLQKETNDFTDSQVQQLNLFFQKNISPSFSSFVNLQIVNNFNSKNMWGAFSLEEAWVNYQYNDAFNVKAGYLIPKFNYLNEIQNKTPLLPYLIRPLVYEASLTNIVNPTDYLPTKAFLQISGSVFSDELTFEYSAFVGPSEDNYIANDVGDGAITPGVDTTNFKTFGGRVGILYSDLRIGTSFTTDKDNQKDMAPGDDVNRTRLGFDI